MSQYESMKHLLFLDIETTGLVAEHSELIELSAVRVSEDFQTETAVFDELVHPEELISDFITRLTGITNDMVKKAPGIEQVRSDFLSFLKPTDIICGHNIRFDTNFLNVKGFGIQNEVLDTFPLSSILLPNEPSYSLEILTEKFDIPHEDAHRALADVRANLFLFRELVTIAQRLPQELKKDFQEIFSKTKWMGKMAFFEKKSSEEKHVHEAPSSALAKKKKGQLSLFLEGEEDSYKSSEVSPEKEKASSSEKNAAKRITELLRQEERSLFLLPFECNEQQVGKEIGRIFTEYDAKASLVLSVPRLFHAPTISGFTYWASPEKVVCEPTFEKWKRKKTMFSETEAVATLKLLREKYHGNSLILSNMSFLREEWDVTKNWVSDNHVQCKSDCSAKRMLLERPIPGRYLCEYSDTAKCPADYAIVLNADSMADALDATSRKTISLNALERWLEEISSQSVSFSESLLFGIGLLKRFVRERTGEGPFRKNLILSPDIVKHEETENLSEGFRVAAKEIFSVFPEETERSKKLKELSDFLCPPFAENELRFITIHPDNSLFLTRADISLIPAFENAFSGKKSVLFVGNAFLQRGGKFLFGSGLQPPTTQEECVSEFEYSRNVLCAIPLSGGNSKTSDASGTAKTVREILPLCSGNILTLFPGASIAEHFVQMISESAEKNGFQVVMANHSSGKVTSLCARGKTILIATNTNWQKVDFQKIPFDGCIQHRLFFSPPPDPVEQARNENVSDEFLEISLPQAVRKFRQVLGELTRKNKRFFWFCLDGHFVRSGNFTDEILSALPPALPIRRVQVGDMPKLLKEFWK
ncbi:hypothetical protein IPN35_06555 [Candidatus Peregrinibacteria bacterium]|nr:MAG: hypothetical protein IPN35_06555 [Candidatus Peregrinibacteria bacterium]